jgi:triacylglycerol lipase
MSSDIAAKLRKIGPRIEVEQTAAIYAPLHTNEPYTGVAVRRDEPYGPHERNVLDVFSAEAPVDGLPEGKRPVLVFVHGGGFTRGDKHTPGTPFYDNLMLWAVGTGLVGVNINYRLAPESSWPSGIEDLRGVLAWLGEHIETYGGDPTRIFLWGHSAGAAHVGDFISAQTHARKPTKIAGAILTSGFYALGDEVSIWQAYYGDDIATYPERSSLAGLVAAETPLFIADAELDPGHFGEQCRLLLHSLKTAGRRFDYVHLEGHSHISETYAVGTADRSLSDPVNAFIRANGK